MLSVCCLQEREADLASKVAAETERQRKSSQKLQELTDSLQEKEFSLTAQRSQVGQSPFRGHLEGNFNCPLSLLRLRIPRRYSSHAESCHSFPFGNLHHQSAYLHA